MTGLVLGVLLGAVSLLLLLGFGLHAWISGKPFWGGLVMSGVGFVSGLILLLIGVGHDLHWWRMDGETYDNLASIWTGVTVVVAFAAGVIARFTIH